MKDRWMKRKGRVIYGSVRMRVMRTVRNIFIKNNIARVKEMKRLEIAHTISAAAGWITHE